METKLPVRFLKPRFLREVPRSKYCCAPQLQGQDEQSRKSFIALLRNGPKPSGVKSRLASQITINCAIWMSLNKPLSNTVSLLLHVKEKKEEYCLLVDESSPENSDSLMLSGSTTIHPKSDIEFIRIACSGLTNDYHVFIDELHLESEIEPADNSRLSMRS